MPPKPVPDPTADPIPELVAEILPRIRDLRRDLHRHPELMYREHRTGAVVQAALDALDVPYRAGLARGTGVVAHLPATVPPERAGEAVALRADMDALPIDEATGAAHASEVPGVMHACGHDGHTAMLVGAAEVLSRLDHRPRPVTFLFQPAEEGGAGALRMVEDGALGGDEAGGLGPRVGRVYGLHGWPDLAVGHVATRPGPLLAACHRFDVVVHGRGGHAAHPERTVDPVVAAAHMVAAVQTVVSRTVGPHDAAVVTVASIVAGSAFNVVPDQARLVGTTRAFDDDVMRAVREGVERTMTGVAAGLGCRAEVAWDDGFPVTSNDPSLAETFFAVARAHLGEGRVELASPSTGSEDFAYYARQAPSCFFLLGLRPSGAATSPQLHQPDFDFNDDALATGIEALCRLALEG